MFPKASKLPERALKLLLCSLKIHIFRFFFSAVCADIPGGCAAHGYIGIAHSRCSTERYRHSYADVLGDSERAGSVFLSAAGGLSRSYNGLAAAFGVRHSCFCVGSNSHRNADGCALVARSRAGLVLSSVFKISLLRL